MIPAPRSLFHLLAAASMLAALAGCLGSGPTLAYLRLAPPRELLCPPASPSADAAAAARAEVAVREVLSLPALERQAVLFANGPVLTPSVTLAFEGTPAELTRIALAEAMRCSPGLVPVSADAVRRRPPLELRVRLTAFEVQGEQRVFRVGLDAEVTDTASGRPAGFKSFAAQAPIGSAAANELAEAAQAALGRAVGELAAWLAATAAAR